MMINVFKYNTYSHWYCLAMGAWIDYDEGKTSLIQTYDLLDVLFDTEDDKTYYNLYDEIQEKRKKQ